MRHRNAALVALILILFACAAEEGPPSAQLTFVRFERTFLTMVATAAPVRPAAGNVFVTVHLIEDPARQEPRKWINSVIEDWDGRKYQAKFAGVYGGSSAKRGLFGRRTKTLHPDRIQVVFEVPQTSVVRNVTVPNPISLLATPPRLIERQAPLQIARRVEPHYPEAARRKGIEGLVKLEVLVMPDGTVGGARHIHGPRMLGEAAAAAVRQWRYVPQIVDGKAVPALIEVQLSFRAN